VGQQALNGPDASKKITTYQIAEPNSAFNAKHRNVGIILRENKETLHTKRRMETHTVTSARKPTHLEVIQNQEKNQGRVTPEQLLQIGHTCRQQQRVGGARWR
jgi:hypothetical protein